MKKQIITNSVYNFIYKLFSTLFPLITLSYTSHVLGAEGVGGVSYANTVVLYFITIASLGIPNYGVKVVASVREDKRGLEKAVSELIWINGITTTVAIVLYYCMVNFIPSFSNKAILHNILGVLLILNYFNIDWYFQGLEQYKYITIRSIIIKLLSLILILLLVNRREDINIYAWILCFGTAGNYILNFCYLKRNTKLFFGDLQLAKHLKHVLLLMVSVVATDIYTMLDVVMIEHFCGDRSVGYYSNSVKIIRVLHSMIISLVATFFPYISNLASKKDENEINNVINKGIKVIIFLAVPIVIGLNFTANDIVVLLFGEEFFYAGVIIRILSPLIFVFGVAYLLGHLMLIATGNEKRIVVATIIGALINVVLNLWLIPKYGERGAALTSVISEVCITVLLIGGTKSFFTITFDRKYFTGLVVSNVLLFVFLDYINSILNTSLIVGFIIIVLGAAAIYFVSFFAIWHFGGKLSKN